MKYLIIIIYISAISVAFCQKQGNIWYFGKYAGVDFNGPTPLALTDGVVNTNEGCATICDKYGKLVFYTDGIKVWDRNHNVMPNGDSLMGHRSSTQSGVIVPKPLNSNIYYVFTVTDKSEDNGFRYSIVDMSLNGGAGDVTLKNALLVDSCVEKITAVSHANKTDIWVIMHEWRTNRFRAFLLTENGINTIENPQPGYPVISAAGAVHEGDMPSYKIGYLKASPKSDRIALAVHAAHLIELFDFNDTTGYIRYRATMQSEARYGGAYGIEFSPDGSKLYASCMFTDNSSQSKIYQFDLEAADIPGSGVLIAEINSTIEFGALQLAPNAKIYIARNNKTFLAAINRPDLPGTACNFQDNALPLAGRTSLWGLPTFIQSFFYLKVKISADFPLCEGETLSLECNDITNGVYEWTGPNGFKSNIQNPKIPDIGVAGAGKYIVNVTMGEYSKSDSIVIEVWPKPKINAGYDLNLCAGDSAVIGGMASGGTGKNYSYKWTPSDGLSSDETPFPIAKPNLTTTYILTVEDSVGCVSLDSVTLVVNDVPEVDAGEDFEICRGDTAFIGNKASNGAAPYSYKWSPAEGLSSDTSAEPSAFPAKSTEYALFVVDANGCICRDTIKITVNENPSISFPGDIKICYGDSVKLEPQVSLGKEPYYYNWSPSVSLDDGESPQPLAMPASTTKYFLKAADANGCSCLDSTTVIVEDRLLVSIVSPTDSASPGSTVEAGILLESASGLNQSFDIPFTAKIKFNGTILHPLDLDILSDSREGVFRELQIRGETKLSGANDTIFPLTFKAALGNSACTDIEISDFVWDGGICEVNIKDKGSFCLAGICYENGARLLYPGGAVNIASITPNPSDKSLTAIVSTIEKGVAKLYIADIIGRPVKTIFNEDNITGERQYFIDTSEISDGLYFLILQTPTVRRAVAFRIMH